jgi:SAM-dependent methyltransferase
MTDRENDAQTSAEICPVCRGQVDEVFGGLFDDRYGYPALFSLRKCRSCGHRFVPAHFTHEELGDLYTSYYPRKNFDIDSFQPAREVAGFRAWLSGERGSAFRWVPKNVAVLDIGCGVGHTLAYHQARGCDAVGIEADDNVLAIAARYGLNIVRGVFDGSQFETSSFDYVTLDQVAEHVLDPVALMRGVHRVLKPGGWVVITTPNPDSLGARLFGRYWLNWHVPYHMQFYTKRSMKKLASAAGLRLAKAYTITASEWQFYQWRHVATFPERGQKSFFWCPGEAKDKPHPLDNLIAKARRYRLHLVISRVLDALGIGDNRVFILRKP